MFGEEIAKCLVTICVADVPLLAEAISGCGSHSLLLLSASSSLPNSPTLSMV